VVVTGKISETYLDGMLDSVTGELLDETVGYTRPAYDEQAEHRAKRIREPRMRRK
jgi:hypothetical protein